MLPHDRAGSRYFTIVNCLEIIYLGFLPARVSVLSISLCCPFFMEDMNMAAKPDARSGYITLPAPYSVFTSVNRKKAMNTHHANIAGPAAGPDTPGTAARASPGILPGKPVEWLSGIRGSGQYCTLLGLTKKDPPVTAIRLTRGMMAVHGMCP